MHITRRLLRAAVTIVLVAGGVAVAGSTAGAVDPLGTPDLKASSDTGISNTDDITNDATPTIVAVGSASGDIVVLLNAADQVIATTSAEVGGVIELTPTAALTDGVHALKVQRGAEDAVGGLSVTIDTLGLTAGAGSPGVPDLQAASDSGASNSDNVTNIKSTATFDVSGSLPAEAAAIELLRGTSTVPAASIPKGGLSGTYGPSPIVDTSTRADGTYAYSARYVDVAGNGGTPSAALNVTFDTSGFVLAIYFSGCDTGRANNDAYTTGFCTNTPVSSLNNLYIGWWSIFGASPGVPLTFTRTDPAGTTVTLAPSPGLIPSTGGASITSLIDILSVLPGSPPMNGKWTYTVRQTDIAGNTATTPFSVTIDTVAPSLPVIDLAAASDTGTSNTDNVTQWNATGVNTTLTFNVTSEMDSAVDFFRNGDPVQTQQIVPVGAPGYPTNPVVGTVIPTATVSFADNGKFSVGGANAYTLSAWHGVVATAIDKAGNSSAGNMPVYVDVDTPVAPLQLDLIAEDDHGTASDDNITNLESPRFQVRGAEDGAIVEMTACEGPGCTLVLSLSPFVTRSTRTSVIGTTTSNGIIQPELGWWQKTAIKILDNYTSGEGPALPGNAANTSWRFNVRQRDLSGRQGTTFSQDLSVVIDTTPLPTPSKPEFIPPSELSMASSQWTGSVNPTFMVDSGSGRVQLLRNGTVVATRTGAGTITDPGPLTNGTYSYTTQAVDTAGNVSPQSAATVVTVQNGGGYWLVGSDGGVFAFGDAGFFGSTGNLTLNAPVLAMSSTPTKNGYWLLGRDGGVFSFGDAGFFGSTGSLKLNSPVKGMASTKTGTGYWLFAEDGGLFAFGDAPFLGSAASSSPGSPIVAIAATGDSKGYWLVSSAGQVYAFGSAAALGGLENTKLNAPIVGAAATSTGKGLWLVAADGGVFGLGDAAFHGSAGNIRLNSPVIGITALPAGDGYYLLAADGGVFSYGKAAFHGSTGSMVLNRPIVGMAAT